MQGLWSRKSLLMAVITAVAAIVFPVSGATGASGDNGCYRFKASEKSFKNKINLERADLGLNKLKLDPELSKVAKTQARRMARRSVLEHTKTEKLKERVTNWKILGENVGVGGGVTSLHQAFMDSPAHADNVLYNSFKRVGVGVKTDDKERMWVAVIFEADNNPGTTLKMPSC